MRQEQYGRLPLRGTACSPTAEPPRGVSSASPLRPTGANDVIRTPYGDACRQRDRIQAVRDRYWSLKNKLAARMEREIRRIEREGV